MNLQPEIIESVRVRTLHHSYPAGGGFTYAGGRVNSRTTSLITVVTESGITGIGSAYSHPDLARVIIDGHLARHLQGQNALEIERLWARMYELTRWYGRKGAAMATLGGIDVALWDIRGKAEGQPVYRLLGGSDPEVAAYGSGLFWTDDLGEITEQVTRYRADGFTSVKMRLGKDPEYDRRAVATVRQALGEQGRILVDGSHRYDVAGARKLAKDLSPLGVGWFEEPFPPEDLDKYVALRSDCALPLAAGENEFGMQGFRELARVGAVDIMQADASRAGGITEVARVANLAADLGLRFAPHTWSDAIAVTANAHLVAAAPTGLTVEVDRTGNPFIDDLLDEPLTVADGKLRLSDRPGLGITLNEDVVDRLALAPDQWLPDGNYSDLIFGADPPATPASPGHNAGKGTQAR
jgi:D-galactarolactone cycloisomerase